MTLLERFENLDLRNQVKKVEGLKIYRNEKHLLAVEKHTVIYDKGFRFQVEMCGDAFVVRYYINDDLVNPFLMNIICDDTEYSSDENEILLKVLRYINLNI